MSDDDDDDDDDENHPIEGNFEWVTKDVHGLMKTFLRPDVLFEDAERRYARRRRRMRNVDSTFFTVKIVRQRSGNRCESKDCEGYEHKIRESEESEIYMYGYLRIIMRPSDDLSSDKSTLDYLMSAEPLVYLEKIRSKLLSRKNVDDT